MEPPSAEEQRRSEIALNTAIRRLHTQTGHPSPEGLARAIRLAGGSDDAVAAALALRCPVCARAAPPGPALPASLKELVKEFGDLVALDTFELADAHQKKRLFLNIVDAASRFQLVVPIQNRPPTTIWLAILEVWSPLAGFPERWLVDGGG